MITRRQLVVTLGAAALTGPSSAFAQQQPAKIARIGFLGSTSLADWRDRVEALRAGFRDLGYVEGKNLVIEFRWAEGKYERLPELAAELVRAKVDLIITHGTVGTRAASKATTTLPIVIAAAGDAVAVGLVASISRPGGNITGSTFFNPELAAKRLEMLKEAFPRTKHVAALFNPDNAALASVLEAMQDAAPSLKIELQQFQARGPHDVESAFSAMAKAGMDAAAIADDATLTVNLARIVDVATKYRILLVGNRTVAERGGVLGYGVDIPAMHRRAAYFADKILKGARPADLPIERATRFELIVNMKAAKTLGLAIPQSILVRADRVIE